MKHRLWCAVGVVVTTMACGGRAVEPSESRGSEPTTSSPTPAPATSPASAADAAPSDACPDGGSCTRTSCACKPIACPDPRTVSSGTECTEAPSLVCPSSAFRGCADAPVPAYVPCRCEDGHWRCDASQFDGDCCKENGPCGTSYQCTIDGAGACGGPLLLTCSNGTYQRSPKQPDCAGTH